MKVEMKIMSNANKINYVLRANKLAEEYSLMTVQKGTE